MPELTPQQRETLLANSRENRHRYPPIAMGGIGQEPLALVPSIFGGLAILGTAPDQPLGTSPEKITGFDQIVPDFSTVGIHPEGLLPDPTDDDIQVLTGGIYLVNIRINATVSSGSAYRFEVYVNDSATGVYTAQDLSNQSGFLSAVLIAPIKVNGGDIISAYGSADSGGQTFTMQNSSFFVSMIR